jgi:phospholipase D1/2
MHILYTTAQKFLVSQPFNSFAPPREESAVKWFVDGSDYMEAVADSIEAAKQEIFITGFFLSPEIYLKRPVIQGDIWRLDKLLQRKAVIYYFITDIKCRKTWKYKMIMVLFV